MKRLPKHWTVALVCVVLALVLLPADVGHLGGVFCRVEAGFPGSSSPVALVGSSADIYLSVLYRASQPGSATRRGKLEVLICKLDP